MRHALQAAGRGSSVQWILGCAASVDTVSGPGPGSTAAPRPLPTQTTWPPATAPAAAFPKGHLGGTAAAGSFAQQQHSTHRECASGGRGARWPRRGGGPSRWVRCGRSGAAGLWVRTGLVSLCLGPAPYIVGAPPSGYRSECSGPEASSSSARQPLLLLKSRGGRLQLPQPTHRQAKAT